MTTAAEIITNALRIFGIIDQTEDPQPADIANNVKILNNLLRAEQSDGACQYLIERGTFTLPPGVSGQVYSFTVGFGSSHTIQTDAVAVRAIYVNDISPTINRETRIVPYADVVRTTFPGMITKWHQERQVDGSILVHAWQPPRTAVQILIEIGGRVNLISAPDGSDVVALPPEGIDDATLLLGRRICTSYGRSLEAVGLVAKDAEAVNARWRDWARGQQWLRLVRA